jgi:hypothetical protein
MMRTQVGARPGSAVWRLLTWPIGPVFIVGRLVAPAPPPRASEVLERSGLALETQRFVAGVVGRTRLWHREQAEVARELVAHFLDAADAGVPPERAMRDFGDPARAARLIRRAKRRARGPVWHTWIRAWQTVLLVLLAAAMVYALLVVRFQAISPTVSRDYVAELSAPALAVPESQRAWPLYREAYLSLGLLPKGLTRQVSPRRYARPGDEAWPEVRAFLSRHADALELTRRAAARPALGYAMSEAPDAEVHVAQMLAGGASPERAHEHAEHLRSEERPLFLQLWDTHALRTLVRMLVADTQEASTRGEGGRARDNLRALVGVASHVREIPMALGDQLGMSMFMGAAWTLGDVIAERPELFSDAELRELAHVLGGFGGGGRLRVSFEGERAMVLDLIQHAYSDDGRGQGRLTAAGIELLRMFIPDPEAHVLQPGMQLPADRLAYRLRRPLLHPVLSAMAADREETTAEAERMFSHFESHLMMPPWAWESQPELRFTGAEWRMRHPVLAAAMPAVSALADHGEHATVVRDGVLVAIALELHRRRHGAYPDSLEALVPHLLPRIPVDPFDGAPMRYHAGEDGRPVVYVVGADGRDDGGIAPPDEAIERQNRMFWRRHALRSLAARGRTPLEGDWVLWPRVDLN